MLRPTYLGRIEAQLEAGGGVQLRPHHHLQAAHQQARQQAPYHSSQLAQHLQFWQQKKIRCKVGMRGKYAVGK